MSVDEVQQVPQSAASPVPPFITDAVFQHHIVGADGPQDGVDLLRRLLRIHLIHLLTQTAGLTSCRARLFPALSKTQPTNVSLQNRCKCERSVWACVLTTSKPWYHIQTPKSADFNQIRTYAINIYQTQPPLLWLFTTFFHMNGKISTWYWIMNEFAFHIFTKCGCEAPLTHCYLDNGKTETGLVLFYVHPHKGNKQGIPHWMSNKRPSMFYKSSKSHYVCVCVHLLVQHYDRIGSSGSFCDFWVRKQLFLWS